MTAGSGQTSPGTPLYVDLDGTLTSTDTLWESVCLFLRAHPTRAWQLPIRLLSGKSAFKRYLAGYVCPDAASLPYHDGVLSEIRSARADGRRTVLATAADESIARAVADELELFDEVLATTPERNLRGDAKREAILEDCAGGAFEYAGDAAPDLDIWKGAETAILVNAPARFKRQLESDGVATRTLGAAVPVSPLRALAKALRPHQWLKNALLFAPLTLAQQLGDSARLLDTLIAFVAFSCIASFGYLLNDLLDIEADRAHETKCKRPFAAGTLPIPTGLATAGFLIALGFGLSFAFVSQAFAAMLGIYLVATVSYSFYLKERLFLDVLVLAGLYTHRVLSGGVAADVVVSTWLLAFSVFFFLSLALVKRYVELIAKQRKVPAAGDSASEEEVLSRRAYQPVDLGLVETMGITAGYLSILVLGLYVSRDDVTQYYAQPELLWLITPLMLYWISRVWFLARRGELNNDPVLFAATDRISYCVVAGVGVIGLIAAMWGRTS